MFTKITEILMSNQHTSTKELLNALNLFQITQNQNYQPLLQTGAPASQTLSYNYPLKPHQHQQSHSNQGSLQRNSTTLNEKLEQRNLIVRGKINFNDDQSYLPSPKMTVKLNQSNHKLTDKLIGQSNQYSMNQIDNQFYNIDVNVNGYHLNQNLEPTQNINESQMPNFSIIGNQEDNPEDVISSQKQIFMKSLQSMKSNPINISHLKLKRNIKNIYKNKQSNKTEYQLLYYGSNSKDQSSSFCKSKFERNPTIRQRKHKNFSLNSNVVSYCQEIHKNEGNIHIQQPRKRQNASKVEPYYLYKGEQKQRYKSQNSRVLSKLQKQHSFDFEQLEAKAQLKIIYEKKKKLQERLLKLNKELNKMTSDDDKELSKRGDRLRLQPITQNHKSHSNSKYISNPSNSKTNLQNSQKAIEFVQKVSKQSLKRRISHHKRINKQVIERAKQEVCLNCSRHKCEIEVIEGEVRHRSPARN